MNKRVSLIMVGVALLLCAASILLNLSVKQAPRLTGRAFKIAPAQVEALDLFRGEKLVASFSREQKGAWTVDLPELGATKNAADRLVIEGLLAFIARAEIQPVKGMTRGKAGLEGGNVLQCVVRSGDKASSVYLGSYSADGKFRYFASDDDPGTVLEVEGGLARVFDRRTEEMRSMELFDLGSRGPDRITVNSGRGTKELVLELTPEGWVILSPVNWPADSARVGSLLRFCAMLRATGIRSEVKLADTTDLPSISLRVGGRIQTVFFALPGGEPFARRGDRDEVYELTPGFADVLAEMNADVLRSRKLELLKNRQVAALELTNEEGKKLRLSLRDGKWMATGVADFPVEKPAVENLVRSLDNLLLVNVVDDAAGNLMEFGLDRPEMSISALDAGGSELANVRVASVPLAAPVQGPGRYYAAIGGRKQIVELNPLMGNFLLQDFLQYRSRLVCNRDFRDVLKIRVETPDFQREYWQNTPTQYQLAHPKTALLSEKGNWEMLRLAKDLAGLRCEGYVPEKNDQKADLGLDRPQLKTILTMRSVGGGAPEVLELRVGDGVRIDGQPAGGGGEYYYAHLSGINQILILNKKFVERLLMEYK